MLRRGKPQPQHKEMRKLEQEMETAIRIFPFQLFDNVKELEIEQPITAEAVGDSFFVVPTISEKINLYGIEELSENESEVTLISDFDVVSVSRSVHYLPFTGWMVSLEKHPVYKTVARVYFNWRSPCAAQHCVAERNFMKEIVGVRFESSKQALGGGEDLMKQHKGVNYIEIPSERNIRRAAVCPATQKLAFATKNYIKVWSYSSMRLELLYTVKVDFDIEKIDLFDGHLAYASFAEVRVIRVDLETGEEDYLAIDDDVLLDDRDPVQSSPLEAYTPIEDDHMGECLFNAVSGNTMEPKLNLHIPALAPPTAQSRRERVKSSMTFEVLGPTDNNHCITPNSLYSYRVKSCVTLVHRQFPSSSWLHSVHFLPEYHLIPEYFNLPEESTPETKRERIIRNIKKQTSLEEPDILSASKEDILDKMNSARSIRCMIGTSRNGYLYDVSDPRLLSEYSFTEHTFGLKLTPSMMYTLTRSGLIMWSVRCCSSAGERFPAPCVVGIEIIPKPRHLTVVGDYFISTPPVDDKDGDVVGGKTMLLKSKNLLSLFAEIREFAMLNQKTSYEAYFQLMLELHFLLEAKLQNLNQRLLKNTNYYEEFLSSYPSPSNPEIDQELHQLQIESTLYYEKRKESSGALGDYQLRSTLFSRASVFYAESDRPLSSVIEPFLAAIQEEAKSSARRGILNYLDAILFDPDKTPLIDETPELADKILAIYYTLAKPKLASVILDSSLSKYNQEIVLQLLEESTVNTSKRGTKKFHHQSAPFLDASQVRSSLVLPDISPSFKSTGMSLKNIFVRGLLYLDLGHPERATADFLSLEPEVLIEFCEQNPQLFMPDIMPSDNNTEDVPKVNLRRSGVLNTASIPDEETSSLSSSTLGKILYSINAWIVLEILIRTQDKIPIKAALRLLKSDKISELDADKVFVLENYLEWILTESGTPNAMAYELLTSIYITHWLKDPEAVPDPVKSGEGSIRRKWLRQHRNSLLHHRADWLNQISPFDGINHFASRSPFSSVDEEPTSPKFYLQKLQGLLGAKEFNFPSTINPLLQRIEREEFEGKLSLQLLCLPTVGRLMEAVHFITEKCPHITCAFTARYCSNLGNWKDVLEFLASPAASYQVYTEIISHLVKVQNPGNFVSLLPDNGNMQFFLPYIEQCFRLHYASHLKSSIAFQAKSRVTN